MSDAVIFALLFATYGTLMTSTVGGPTPSSEFKFGSVLLQTLILLTSSFTFGMASIEIKHQAQNHVSVRFLFWMGSTLTLGLAFLCLELRDFAEMFMRGAYPSRSGFLSGFFALVLLHGTHVMAGCLWLIVLVIQACALGCDAWEERALWVSLSEIGQQLPVAHPQPSLDERGDSLAVIRMSQRPRFRDSGQFLAKNFLRALRQYHCTAGDIPLPRRNVSCGKCHVEACPRTSRVEDQSARSDRNRQRNTAGNREQKKTLKIR